MQGVVCELVLLELEVFFIFYSICLSCATMPSKKGVAKSKSLDEQELRMQLLEAEVMRLRKKDESRSSSKRKRAPSPASSDESSLDDSSSDSGSSCRSSSSPPSSSPERKSRKAKKVKRRRKSRKQTTKWTNISYEHQYNCLADSLKYLDRAGDYLDSDPRKARKQLRKAQAVMKKRVEWLVVANKHGHETATSYTDADELSELVTSSAKKKRLQAAIESTKSVKTRKNPRSVSVPRPFLSSTPAKAADWGASPKPNTDQVTYGRPVTRQLSGSTGGCHHCGEQGHYIRYCPKLQQGGK